MPTRLAINGFGRIGRMVLRAFLEGDYADLEIIAINHLYDPDTCAHLLAYDSVHGRCSQPVAVEKNVLVIGDRRIRVYKEQNPAKLPWKMDNIDVVLECSGALNDGTKAASHLNSGARKVLISAPANHVDETVVFGVNQEVITQDTKIVSNASCTTNCLAPVAKVLDSAVGIERGYMTTIHAFTRDQCTVDAAHKDLRRARAASMNIIPTSTGAARAVGLVLPTLQGKLDGCAMRVPTADVSLIDLKFDAARACTVDIINQAIITASQQSPLKGILAINREPLVSSDFIHHPASSIFDLTQTQVMDQHLVRVVSWYDNEWGFANRMLDNARLLATR